MLPSDLLLRGCLLHDELVLQDLARGVSGDGLREHDPHHVPVFVLTHQARASIPLEGGTTFHFVTDGIEAALERATQAAHGKDVRLGGGANTIRQYLTAGLIDKLHLAVSPVVLGRGEPLFPGIDTARLGYRCTEHVSTAKAMHVVLTR
jgi:dihydrofolate reductase